VLGAIHLDVFTQDGLEHVELLRSISIPGRPHRRRLFHAQ